MLLQNTIYDRNNFCSRKQSKTRFQCGWYELLELPKWPSECVLTISPEYQSSRPHWRRLPLSRTMRNLSGWLSWCPSPDKTPLVSKADAIALIQSCPLLKVGPHWISFNRHQSVPVVQWTMTTVQRPVTVVRTMVFVYNFVWSINWILAINAERHLMSGAVITRTVTVMIPTRLSKYLSTERTPIDWTTSLSISVRNGQVAFLTRCGSWREWKHNW
jgi:hypothetical protein